MNPAPPKRGWVNPAPRNWYYVYLLRSKKNGSFYIGSTSDLYKRLRQHEEGKNYTTSKMLPIELIYFESYKSKKDAFEREKRLKHYGSSLRNLKLRLGDTFKIGGAG